MFPTPTALVAKMVVLSTVAASAFSAPVGRGGLPARCDTLAEWRTPGCQAYCRRDDYPTLPQVPWCDTACRTAAARASDHCQGWCATPAFAAVLPYCSRGAFERHELGPQYMGIGGRALDGTPALFHYRRAPEGAAGTKWAIFFEGGGACATNAECWARSTGKLGSSAHPQNAYATRQFGDGGLFGEDPLVNPGFWDAHKVFVPYLSGDVHLGTRTDPYTFPDDPDWGTLAGQDAAASQPEFYFSGHLNFVHIIDQLTTNATFTANGGGIGQATDVLLTGCSAGGFGARGNADWLYDTLPATTNFRAAPAAGLTTGSQTFANFEAGVPGGYPLPLPAHVPAPATVWQLYVDPVCIANNRADRTEEEAAAFCMSNEGFISSIRTPTLWISPQFDTYPLTHQYSNASDRDDFTFSSDDYATAIGQEYLAQWGRESRRLLFDNAEFVYAPSCLDHCGVTPLKGSGGPGIGGHSSLDVINDWFFGHDLLSHKVIEGMSPDGVDQHPNDGLPFNPTCDNLDGDSLIEPTEGCTDPLATNYAALATVDDGSCLCALPEDTSPCSDQLELTDPPTDSTSPSTNPPTNPTTQPPTPPPTPPPTTPPTTPSPANAGETDPPADLSTQPSTPTPTLPPTPLPSRPPTNAGETDLPTAPPTQPLTPPPTPPPTPLPTTSSGQDPSTSASSDDGDSVGSTAITLIVVIALLVVACMAIGVVMYKRQADAAVRDPEAYNTHRKAPAQANPSHDSPARGGSVRSLILDSSGTFRSEMAPATGPDNGLAEHSI